MKHIFPLFLIIFSLLSILSCTKKTASSPREDAAALAGFVSKQPENSPPAAPLAAAQAGLAETQKPERTLSLNLKEDIRETAVKNPVAAAPPSGKKDFLTAKTTIVPPEDMEIGPLQEQFAMDDENLLAAMKTVVSFFDAYKANKGWMEMLHPDLTLVLSRGLEGYNANPSTAIAKYRLGGGRIRDNTCSFNIRLLSVKGKTEGEIYLEKKQDTWYISDIQADLAALGTVYKKEGVFEPALYRWLTIP